MTLAFWSARRHRRFVVFSQGRTGSHLLCDLLDSHPEVMCRGEVLQRGKDRTKKPAFRFPGWYLERRSQAARQLQLAAWGFSLKVSHLTLHGHRVGDPERFLARLHSRGWILIWLRRENILRQALSIAAARRKQRWFLMRDEAEPHGRTEEVDPDELLSLMAAIRTRETLERRALRGLPHLPLVYERNLLRPEYHQPTANRVFEFLGLGLAPVSTRHRRLGRNRLSEQVPNLDEIRRALRGTEYATYLED